MTALALPFGGPILRLVDDAVDLMGFTVVLSWEDAMSLGWDDDAEAYVEGCFIADFSVEGGFELVVRAVEMGFARRDG